MISTLTRGVMADRAIFTQGVVDATMLDAVAGLISKGGTVAIAGVAPASQIDAKIGLFNFVLYEKAIKGGLYGGWDARNAVPLLLDLYRAGELKLDELITKRYRLEEMNQGYTDMREGRNIRGVIIHD